LFGDLRSQQSGFEGLWLNDYSQQPKIAGPTGCLTALAESFASPTSVIGQCFDIIRPTRIILPDVAKPWVPIEIENGLLHFANGTVGQNGLSNFGCLGVRAVPAEGIAVAGWFGSQLERDQILSQVIDSLAGFPAETDTRHIVGSLNNVEAESIQGTYQGLLLSDLVVQTFPSSLMVKGILGNNGRLRLERDSCHHLSFRVWSPHLWIGAFRHPAKDQICLRFGQNVYLRTEPLTGVAASRGGAGSPVPT